MSNVIHLTTGAFDQVAKQDSPVLIDFWAPPPITGRTVARSLSAGSTCSKRRFWCKH